MAFRESSTKPPATGSKSGWRAVLSVVLLAVLLAAAVWYVIGHREEVLALRDRYRFRPGHVFLMAEGTDSETLREREKWLAPLCVRHGFRLSDRLHIHLFGDTRAT